MLNVISNFFSLIACCFLIAADLAKNNSILNNGRIYKARFLGAKIGTGVRIKRGVVIKGHKNVTIGDGCFIGEGVVIAAYGERVEIGNNVLIAEGAYFSSRNHRFRKATALIKAQGYKNKKVIVEDDVWIGWGAAILAGAHVRSKTVVGACAVYQETDSATIQRACVSVEVRDEA